MAIVKVDKRHYRKIAQENWGLTDAQMKGMHVHHRTPQVKGGTNDATNLYVCSPWFHAYVWHDGCQFTQWAAKGAAGSIGQKRSEQARKNMSEAAKRRYQRKEEREAAAKRAKGNQHLLGYKHTAETKKRMSEIAKRRGKKNA